MNDDCVRLQTSPGAVSAEPDASRRVEKARHSAVSRYGKLLMYAAALAVLMVVVIFFFKEEHKPPLAEQGSLAAEHWVVLRSRPVQALIDVAGLVEPVRYVPVSAPFDGTIITKHRNAGDIVKAGEQILLMDDSDMMAKLREAEAQHLAARMAVQDIDEWETSADVQRAKRQLEAAKAELARLGREVAELKELYDRGIVPRNEFAAAAIRHEMQKSTVLTAEEDFSATLSRGSDDNPKLATLKLEIAESQLRDVRERIRGAEVLAPIDGILVPPPRSGDGGEDNLHSGARVSRGAAIFLVADNSSFVVSGTIDELDVNQVHPGQKVAIESEALGRNVILQGEVISISSQAINTNSRGVAPLFEIRVLLSQVEESVRNSIRIGMSAQMQIKKYEKSEAFVLPPSAIIQDGAEFSLLTRAEGRVIAVPVKIGESFPEGVEILDGGAEGMEVLLNPGVREQQREPA